MTLSNSRLSYDSCYSIMDKALDDPKGARIKFTALGHAINYRMRLHKARSLDRIQNKETYPDPAHPMHGASLYDKLVCRIRKQGDIFWLYVQQCIIDDFEYELLSELSEEALVDERPTVPLPSPVKEPIDTAETPAKLEWLRRI